jgi:hypothetical protein
LNEKIFLGGMCMKKEIDFNAIRKEALEEVNAIFKEEDGTTKLIKTINESASLIVTKMLQKYHEEMSK